MEAVPVKTVLAVLALTAALAVAAPAVARPIDSYGPIPSGTPQGAPAPAPSSGTDGWLVVAAVALAFAAGAGAARLVPVLKVRAS
jgi:hypothetical protein